MADCLNCGYFKWTKDWGWYCSDSDPRYQDICRFNMFAEIMTGSDKRATEPQNVITDFIKKKNNGKEKN